MKSIVQLLIISALFAMVTATIFKNCGSKGAKINNVTVANCTLPPCILKTGTNVSFSMGFKARVDINSAVAEVNGVIARKKVPFTLPDSDACHFMKCPISTGDTDIYKIQFPVYKKYRMPEAIFIRWEIKQGEETLICFEVAVSIED